MTQQPTEAGSDTRKTSARLIAGKSTELKPRVPDRGYLGTTISTCATCGRLLPAQAHLGDDGVYFHKHCPEHGPQSPRIYGDAEAYLSLANYHRAGAVPLKFTTQASGVCPDNCGLCPEHEQHVCMPILEITDHCDMACPICLVNTPGRYHLERGQVAAILDGLIASEGRIDVLNLSGGEPTANPNFRAIIEECTGRREILAVSVSTNGRRLARDPDLLRFLVEHQVVISLQFDGFSPRVYYALRGPDLADEKRRLIGLVGDQGGRMSLTMTLQRGVNDRDEPARVLELLFAHDHVLSVMFQPMAYIGAGGGIPRPPDPVTIPDVLRAVHGAAGGRVSADDFSPLPCSHPACFAQAFYLRTQEQGFMAVKQLVQTERYLQMIQNRTLFGLDLESLGHVRDALYELWSSPEGLSAQSQQALRAVKRVIGDLLATPCCPGAAMAHAQRAMKSIFIHAFMDRHTFDLGRARKCCQVYPQPDGRLIPACVYNCLRRAP